jgi:hypothetical protein
MRMPCTSTRAVITASVKLKNVNKDLLVEAFKLMHEDVIKVEVQGENTLRVVTKNGPVYVDIAKGEVRMEGSMSKVLESKLTSFYIASIQIASLKRKNMRVEVQSEGDRVRIMARD